VVDQLVLPVGELEGDGVGLLGVVLERKREDVVVEELAEVLALDHDPPLGVERAAHRATALKRVSASVTRVRPKRSDSRTSGGKLVSLVRLGMGPWCQGTRS